MQHASASTAVQQSTSGPSTSGQPNVSQQNQPCPTLSQLYKQHRDASDDRKRQSEQRRKAVMEAVAKVTESMMDGINHGVARVFANQKKIDSETKQLEMQTHKFTKVTSQWVELIDQFNDALKELGDVENWALTIEREMQQVATALAFVHKHTIADPSTASETGTFSQQL